MQQAGATSRCSGMNRELEKSLQGVKRPVVVLYHIPGTLLFYPRKFDGFVGWGFPEANVGFRSRMIVPASRHHKTSALARFICKLGQKVAPQRVPGSGRPTFHR